MAIAKKTGTVKKFNKDIAKPQQAKISCENNMCALDSDVDIMGIQIYFKGKAEITPELPEGWVLQGNDNTIIMFSLSGVAIQKQILFTYKGKFDIEDLILSNKNAEKVTCGITRTKVDWEKQNSLISLESVNWNDMKINESKYKINKTIYNLPDYNLPKVDKTKIKTRRRTTTTTPTYTTGGGSSGGSGGY
jgi:hypothetical protein